MTYVLSLIMPKRKRKYPSKRKTTTLEGYKEYKMLQMREIRKQQKKTMQVLKLGLQRLHNEHPDVYRNVFGNSYDPFGIFRKKRKRPRK
jgi:hypothetical protein